MRIEKDYEYWKEDVTPEERRRLQEVIKKRITKGKNLADFDTLQKTNHLELEYFKTIGGLTEKAREETRKVEEKIGPAMKEINEKIKELEAKWVKSSNEMNDLKDQIKQAREIAQAAEMKIEELENLSEDQQIAIVPKVLAGHRVAPLISILDGKYKQKLKEVSKLYEELEKFRNIENPNLNI